VVFPPDLDEAALAAMSPDFQPDSSFRERGF
jgi:hypothetical protein